MKSTRNCTHFNRIIQPKEKNETARTKYQSIADCKKVASEDWCSIFFLADNGKIDLLPIPNGGNLNVTPRSGN